ncbi:MAG: hypothetical protein ACOY3X_02405 [Pseudomonadota bacterium]
MSFHSSITRLVDTRGSSEERQLVARWRPEIESFLGAFQEGIRKDYQSLEIGLEEGLVLKLVVKRFRMPPVAGLARIAGTLPGLAGACAREVLRAGYDFHVGLRIQADRCHRELYIYDRNREFTRFLETQVPLPPRPEGASVVTAYGIDEQDGVSAYLTVRKNPRVAAQLPLIGQKLEQELRVPLGARVKDLWEHLRLQDGRWQPGKFGIELHDLDLQLATRIISHYRPPHFGYLVPLAEYASIVIAGMPSGGIRGWYFTRQRTPETLSAPARLPATGTTRADS